MTRIIAWFAQNHVAANLLMALLVVGGLITLPTIKQEVFPEIQLPVLSISVDYPGASPKEVEAAICVRIEQAIEGLQGVKTMRSTAGEGHGSVTVELFAGEDVRRRMGERMDKPARTQREREHAIGDEQAVSRSSLGSPPPSI